MEKATEKKEKEKAERMERCGEESARSRNDWTVLSVMLITYICSCDFSAKSRCSCRFFSVSFRTKSSCTDRSQDEFQPKTPTFAIYSQLAESSTE